MWIIQICSIIAIFFTVSFLILRLLKRFGRIDIAVYFILPIFIYCLGFALRLSGKTELIDLGYFFTEGTYIIIYTIFSLAILLGQLKYWKK